MQVFCNNLILYTELQNFLLYNYIVIIKKGREDIITEETEEYVPDEKESKWFIVFPCYLDLCDYRLLRLGNEINLIFLQRYRDFFQNKLIIFDTMPGFLFFSDHSFRSFNFHNSFFISFGVQRM